MKKEYKAKTIPLNSDRRLIYAVKKAGIHTYHPQGSWNGYGYETLPLVAEITSLSEMRKFNKIKKELEQKPRPKVKTDEEKKLAWAKRLVRLLADDDDYNLTVEEALEIADEKVNYHIERINELKDRQYKQNSVRRDSLINKLSRQNPLRYIKDEYHAHKIMDAHHRHHDTCYDYYLREVHEMEEDGELEKGYAKEYAMDMLKYGHSDLIDPW